MERGGTYLVWLHPGNGFFQGGRDIHDFIICEGKSGHIYPIFGDIIR